MNSKQLFNSRVKEDIGLRTYYSKYIFNSHFLLFLTITIGILVYSLIGYIQEAEPSIWFLVIGSLIMTMAVLPSFRSLLKDADGLFLLPYELHMRTYFQGAMRYSYFLNIVMMMFGLAIGALLISINLELLEIIVILFVAVIIYIFNLVIYRRAINTTLNHWTVILILFGLGFISLFAVMLYAPLAPLVPVLIIFIYNLVGKKTTSHLDWFKYINQEKDAKNRYFRVVSMFANVAHMDNQYKRRKYLDGLLPNYKNEAFTKKNMYEYLFFRSFMRDNDLPMIVLRLLLIGGIIMVWLNIWYVSLVIGIFVIYLIVLQMNQIYAQQAYLLWPKYGR